MITITNKNIYYSEISIFNLSSLDMAEVVDIDDIVNFLSEDVELGESVTFKRLFDIVSYNIEKFNDVFYSSLGGHALEPYLQEIENNPTDVIESDYLEVCWVCDRHEDEFNINPSLHGISIKNLESYAMDFVSLNNLKNYILKINREVEIFDYNKIKENIDEKSTYLGDRSFSLFDLYNAIFHEISFFGGPQEKKEKFNELIDSIEEVENMLEDDKTSKSLSFDDMMEKIDSNDKYLVKYKDFRDRVEEDRISNNKNLIKLKNCLTEKLKIFDIIESSDDNLQQYYKKLTDIDYNMQLLYDEDEDISYHRFWETPKCSCPKIDNMELYPSDIPIFDDKCLIHGK